MRRTISPLPPSSPGSTRRSRPRLASAPVRLGQCSTGLGSAQAAETRAMMRDSHLSCPGLTHGCPVNVSLTVGLHGAPVRWSMRSWESVRRRADRRDGFPRSHGPPSRGTDRNKVKRQLMSRCAGSLPEVAGAPAFGPITTTLNRTALDLTRASTARSSEVMAQPGPWIARSSRAMTTWGGCRACHARLIAGGPRQPDGIGPGQGLSALRAVSRGPSTSDHRA